GRVRIFSLGRLTNSRSAACSKPLIVYSLISMPGRLVQLDRVAIGIFNQDLRAARADLDVVPKAYAGLLEVLDLRTQIGDVQHDAVHLFVAPRRVSGGMVRPAALSRMSRSRRRLRVCSRLAVITQWTAARRYHGGCAAKKAAAFAFACSITASSRASVAAVFRSKE